MIDKLYSFLPIIHLAYGVGLGVLKDVYIPENHDAFLMERFRPENSFW